MMKFTFGLFMMMMMVIVVVVQSAPTNNEPGTKGDNPSTDTADSTNTSTTIYKIQEHGFLSDDATTASSTDNYELTCDGDSGPKGTHPNPEAACEQISKFKTGEDFEKALKHAKKGFPCGNNFSPVIIDINGSYQGQEIKFQHMFPNYCVFKFQTKDFANFVDITTPSSKN